MKTIHCTCVIKLFGVPGIFVILRFKSSDLLLVKTLNMRNIVSVISK